MKHHIYFSDGSYAGTSESQRMPNNSTTEALPELPWDHMWPRYDSDHGWLLAEDHRARSVQEYGPDLAQEATDYWLPGDDWQAQPRHMTQIGPLPQDAILKRPEKPESEKLDEAKARKIDEIIRGYDAAMAASLTMPAMEKPGMADVAIGAALFATEDPEGLEFIAQTHADTHDSLMGMVIGAETVEEVEEIAVSYAV